LDIRYVTGSTDEVVSALGGVDTFSLDLETTGLTPIDSRILLCQIGLADGRVYVIDVNSTDLRPILPFLSSVKYTKIIQNSKFERRFILCKYNTPINNVFDTQLAERLLKPESFAYSLKALALKYSDITLDKDIRTSFMDRTKVGGFSEEQIEYAAKDAWVLWNIKDRQEFKLEEMGMADLAIMEFDLAQVVASMEETGVPIDQNRWRTKLEAYKEEHEASRLRMHELLFTDGGLDEQIGLFTRDAINLNSNPQIKSAFIKLGINIDTTNEREIALIKHPAAQELLVYRGLQKSMSAYGESFLEKIHPFTGRIHADFQQIGTETGRFSCKEPNLQQMPDEFRQCVSLEDHVVIAADYSQIELRILAELSNDPKLQAAFIKGEDVHKSTASTMFGMPLENVTKDLRFIAKTINFGINYGMGPGKLMDILNTEAQRTGGKQLGFMEVKSLLERYHSSYKGVSRWLTEAANSAFVKGYSETMMGRKRFYTYPDPTRLSADDYKQQVGAIKRKGANSPIQGTNADITKRAMLNVQEELQEGGYQANIIIQVHDEIVVLAHRRQSEAVKNIMISAMNSAASSVLKKVPVRTDAYISEVWKK
jgi:DNA polymerase-1